MSVSESEIRLRAQLDQARAISDELINNVLDVVTDKRPPGDHSESVVDDAALAALFEVLVRRFEDYPVVLAGIAAVAIMRLAKVERGVPQFTALDELREMGGG